jgi:hypothetical protein
MLYFIVRVISRGSDLICLFRHFSREKHKKTKGIDAIHIHASYQSLESSVVVTSTGNTVQEEVYR